MSPEIPSTPAPTDVAELVRRLISSPWPTTETERRAWFAQNGLDMTEKATEGDFVVAEGPSVWGKPRGGWHFHDGEFVGLYWFLWAGESWSGRVSRGLPSWPRRLRSFRTCSPGSRAPRSMSARPAALRPASGLRGRWTATASRCTPMVPTWAGMCRTSAPRPSSCTSTTPAAVPGRMQQHDPRVQQYKTETARSQLRRSLNPHWTSGVPATAPWPWPRSAPGTEFGDPAWPETSARPPRRSVIWETEGNSASTS